MSAVSVTTRFSEKDIKVIDELVKRGYFTNRSDAIRMSVRYYYYSEMKGLKVPSIIKKLSKIAAERGITEKDVIKACRKAGKKVYKEVYGSS